MIFGQPKTSSMCRKRGHQNAHRPSEADFLQSSGSFPTGLTQTTYVLWRLCPLKSCQKVNFCFGSLRETFCEWRGGTSVQSLEAEKGGHCPQPWVPSIDANRLLRKRARQPLAYWVAGAGMQPIQFIGVLCPISTDGLGRFTNHNLTGAVWPFCRYVCHCAALMSEADASPELVDAPHLEPATCQRGHCSAVGCLCRA